MDPNEYVFRSTWTLAHPPDDVYRVLETLDEYPRWWPQVRSARPLADDTAVLTCRSSLPYDLVFETRQKTRDPEARILAAELHGDLEGFSQWTIGTSGDVTVAVFDEEVRATKELLVKLARVARPAFKVNHAIMMRSGERGLRTYLAGYSFGRRDP